MKLGMKVLLTSVLIVVILSSSACRPWTIVKNEKSEDDGALQIYFQNDDFDTDAFTRDVWDNQLLDYYDNKKVNASKLMNELKDNEAKAGEDYAIGTNDIGSRWQFIIEGKGTIVEVNNESLAGIMMIDVEPYDGEVDFIMQIGPVIKGTTIRDTLDFIKLDDFSNQVEFANLSKAFNKLVVDETLATKDFSKHLGDEITFLGCFTYENMENILVTPITILGLEDE